MSKKLRIVSVGGGTGQSVLLRALREIPADLTAIVAMADDGGSTGILRRDTHTPPPGDIRKCLVALSQNPDSLLARLFAHRMIEVENHALGNLILFSLLEETGDFITAIQLCERELNCRGRVLPSTLCDVSLTGTTCTGQNVVGQAALTKASERLCRVSLTPSSATAYQPSVAALKRADVIILGPGSLFTSIIPNLLLPEIARALNESSAHLIFVCPKTDVPGETSGMQVHNYVEALYEAGLSRPIDTLLIHKPQEQVSKELHAVACDDDALATFPVKSVIKKNFASLKHPYQHDISMLTQAIEEVLSCLSQQNLKTSSRV